MKKYQLIVLLSVMALCYACVKDNSAYSMQEKENVAIDNYEKPGGGSYEPQPGELIPGIYEVKVNVTQPDGETVERRFKYYMPSTIINSRPISFVFHFHDAVTYEWGVEPSDPIWSISVSHSLNQMAARENWITCFPVSARTTNADGSGKMDWTDTENELAYIDAILHFFKSSSPSIDPNRIYGIGLSAGGNFLFELALRRSDTFAAIFPFPATYSIAATAVVPSRAVPVMMTAHTSTTASTLSNMGRWAERVGGYFTSDRVDVEGAYIDDFAGYALVNTYTWSGARGDIELFVVAPVNLSTSLSLPTMLPFMVNFMKDHPLDNANANMFVTVASREFTTQVGQQLEIPFNCTDGATVDLVNVPYGWQIVIEGGLIKITAPADFFADIDRKGSFSIRATLAGDSASATIIYELQPPKTFFEVGDIYYNDYNEPIGVVVWVNRSNIREAKILCLEGPDPPYYNIYFGALGMDFETPNEDDGEANTAAILARNATLSTPLTSTNAGSIWAANYSYKGVGGWYLPAINELAALNPYQALIREKLAELGAVTMHSPLYSSTTKINDTGAKLFYNFNFTTGQIATLTSTNESTGYIYVRAFKIVNM